MAKRVADAAIDANAQLLNLRMAILKYHKPRNSYKSLRSEVGAVLFGLVWFGLAWACGGLGALEGSGDWGSKLGLGFEGSGQRVLVGLGRGVRGLGRRPAPSHGWVRRALAAPGRPPQDGAPPRTPRQRSAKSTPPPETARPLLPSRPPTDGRAPQRVQPGLRLPGAVLPDGRPGRVPGAVRAPLRHQLQAVARKQARGGGGRGRVGVRARGLVARRALRAGRQLRVPSVPARPAALHCSASPWPHFPATASKLRAASENAPSKQP